MINSEQQRKLKLNTATSLINQVVTIICGFILPRLILQSFGTSVNGLVSSISQFLSVISFMEFGVGAVVQSSLYSPLANRNSILISKIVKSSNNFFKKIAAILLVYMLGLIVFFPIIAKNYSFIYTDMLVLAIGVSYFAQYYFGITNQLLLMADQRGYFVYSAQAITVILNTLVCAILIKIGASIQMVKLTTSVIFLIRPIAQFHYVRKHYNIDVNISYQREPIQQKWNGFAQHISAVVLDNADVIVLTVFSTLANVSIYSVYFLVISGVKKIFLASTNGIQSLIGELWARKQEEKLRQTFGWMEWIIHSASIFIFGCTGFLIVPFVRVYTTGITDANYIVPLFAGVLVCAHVLHCLRLPYNMLILAAGHYKQTQSVFIVATIVNLIVSIAFVVKFGLVGVAIGTLVAMAYQLVWMIGYVSKHLISGIMANAIKQIISDLVVVMVAGTISFFFVSIEVSVWEWVFEAIKIVIIWLTVIILVNVIFYHDRIIELIHKIRG